MKPWKIISPSMDETAILIPAMRTHHYERIVANVADVTPEPYRIVWMVGTDADAAELDRLGQSYFRDTGGTWGGRLNHMYHNTSESYLFLGADDLKWHPHWLEHAMTIMARVDGVVSVNDQWQAAGTSALVSRNYIDTMSGTVDESDTLIHPGYTHHGSETELFETAAMRGRYAYCAESLVEHMHFIVGKSEDDDVYALGASRTVENVTLYQKRRHLWQK